MHSLEALASVKLAQRLLPEGRQDAQRRRSVLEPPPPPTRALPPCMPLGGRWGRAPRPPLPFPWELSRRW